MADTDPKMAIKAFAAIAAQLIQALDNDKVSKIAGKSLSEEDFTTTLLNKLNSITGNNSGDQNAVNVPISAIVGITGANVQAVLSELKSMVDAVDSEIGTSILAPVADLAGLKAITGMTDKALVLAETIGLFRYDEQSAVAESGENIVSPTTGGGRWIRMSTIMVQAAIDITISAISGIAASHVQGALEELKVDADAAQASADHAHTDATNALTNAATAQATADAAKAVTDDLINNLTIAALKLMMTNELTNAALDAIVTNY